MKKRLLSLLTLFVSVIGYAQTVGDTFIDNFITYEITSLSPNAVEIFDYDHSGNTDVVIPVTVTNSGTTYNVTSIGDDAFNYNGPTGKITSVAFTSPSNITTIGVEAFRDQNLTTVTIPSSAISISQYAFWHNNLTSVTIENGLESIGSNAFSANNITDIIIPNSVISIDTAAFQSNQITSATLSNSLTSIGASAFSQNQLQSIVIPNSVTSFSSAFSYNQLTSVTLPNGLTEIDISAFRSNNLTHVTIPSTVTNIEYSAFRDNPLATVTSQATNPPTIFVPGINDSFWNRSVIDLTIPNGTSTAYAAGGWTGFNSVTEAAAPAVGDTFVDDFITYEVTSITLNTVMTRDYDTNGGSEVIIPATVNYNATTFNVTIIHTNSFSSNPITNIIIPNSIIQIRSGAFFNNQFTSVVIPSSVTSIGPQAFAANNSLTCVVSEAITPPTIFTGGNVDTFGEGGFGTRSNINLVVPNGTTDEYVTDNGALWTGFKLVYEDTSTTANTLEVTDYHAANGTSVTIPATVTAGSIVYDVTEIGDAAFFSKGLTSVTIPNSVTSIGVSSFNTNNLTNITIPDNVTSIGSQAFVTNDLVNVALGNNVSIIGLGAFADNDLTNVTFPNSVTEIGPVAFAANPLASVTSLATIPPTITTGTNDTFHISGDRSNIHLTIPNGTQNDYIIAQWINFASVTLNITDFELASEVSIFNTKDELKIISNGSVRLDNYTIYSISGAKVKEGTENTIAIDAMANGIYIIELNFDKGRLAKKFVK